MPVFHVRSPDGHVYAVNAPEGATEAQALNYVRSRMPKAAAPAPHARTWGDTFNDAAKFVSHTAGSALDGVAGSWADEVWGAGRTIRNAGRSAVGLEKFDPSGSFHRGQDEYLRDHGRFTRDHPVVHVAATGAGIAGSLAAPLLRAPRAAAAAVQASRLARVGRAAAHGAAWGAASGLGKGRGTDRLGNAVDGAIFGGVVGGAAGPALSLAGRVGRNVANVAAPHISPAWAQRRAATAAQREVGSALEDAHMSPADVSAAAQDAHAVQVPYMPADAADSVRQLTGYASRGVGPAQQAVRDAIQQRQGNMASRVRGHVDEALGPTTNPHMQSETLLRQAQDDARPLYEAAYQQPVTVTPQLREFMDSPLGPSAIEGGANSIRQTPSAARNIGSEQPYQAGTLWDPSLQGGHGAYRSGQVPTLETWDGAKRGLDDIEFAQNSQFLPGPSGLTRDVRPVDLSRRQILAELDAQVPSYAAARRAYAGPIQERRAFEVGNETIPGSGRSTTNDARAQMDGMADSQLAQFRLGDRTRIADEIYGKKAGVRRWGDATAPITANDARLDLIRSIHGGDAADQLMQRIAPERQGHLTYREVFGNSQTGNRRAVDGDMDNGGALAAAGHLIRGNPLAAAWHILSDAGRGRGVGRYTQDLKQELGSMLTDQNPASIQDAMALVQDRMARDTHFRVHLDRATRELTRAGTINVVGRSGDETGIYDHDQ